MSWLNTLGVQLIKITNLQKIFVHVIIRLRQQYFVPKQKKTPFAYFFAPKDLPKIFFLV